MIKTVNKNKTVSVGHTIWTPWVEPCHHLVKHEGDVVFFGDLAQRLEENARVEVSAAALDWLNDDDPNMGRIGLNLKQGRLLPVRLLKARWTFAEFRVLIMGDFTAAFAQLQ